MRASWGAHRGSRSAPERKLYIQKQRKNEQSHMAAHAGPTFINAGAGEKVGKRSRQCEKTQRESPRRSAGKKCVSKGRVRKAMAR